MITVDELRERLGTDYYKNNNPYPYFSSLKKYPEKEIKKKSLMVEIWNKREGKIKNEFKRDALEAVGLRGHHKADAAYLLAWEYGHSSGHDEVLNYLIELANLMVG